MSILRAKLAELFFETPLLIHSGKLVAILGALGGRIVDGGVQFDPGVEALDHRAYTNGRPSAGRLGDAVGRAYDRAGALPFDVVNGVAVIPIEGTLVHKGSYVGAESGRTSYEGIQSQVTRAARSPDIKGVVFEVDSFGGQVSGAFETAAAIAKLSKIKPTAAILTDHAESAGLLLAAPARKVFIPQHGTAGSIGAVAIHQDNSGRLAQMGVKVTVIAAGARKAIGNPFEPLAAEDADQWRAGLEKVRSNFARTIAGYRSGRLDEAAAMATEGESYMGSEAVDRGLADAVGDPSEVFDAFIKAVNR